MALFTELDVVDHLSDIARIAIEALEKNKCLIHGELLGELGVLELNPEQLAEIASVRVPMPSQDLNAAGISWEEALADLYGGRLSGPVGPEEAEAFPSVHLEIQAIDGNDVGVGFSESLNPERREGIVGCWKHETVSYYGKTALIGSNPSETGYDLPP
ncbi:MAG: hypothetical protein NVSMB53_11640 [Gemmatimonadaceae bacterium]